MKEPYYNVNNNPTRNICIKVYHVNGIVVAICEHIEADKIAIGVYVAVSIDKPLKLWVIVTAIKIVEAGFGWVLLCTRRGCPLRHCFSVSTCRKRGKETVMYQQASPFGDKRQVVGIIPSP